MWFYSPCDDSYRPLYTVRLHCTVPWGLVLLVTMVCGICICMRMQQAKTRSAPMTMVVGQTVPMQPYPFVGTGAGASSPGGTEYVPLTKASVHV